MASSKSAMKTLAPELSALMIIFRSTGPVISTRRSRRSAGIGGPFQSPARTAWRLGEEVEALARVEPGLHRPPPREQLVDARRERADEAGHERQRLAGQHALAPGHGRPTDLDTSGDGRGLGVRHSCTASRSSVRGQRCASLQSKFVATPLTAINNLEDFPLLIVSRENFALLWGCQFCKDPAPVRLSCRPCASVRRPWLTLPSWARSFAPSVGART